MAQLKNTIIDSTGFLELPAGSTAQRPGSPSAGMIRYNTTISDTEYYDGGAWRPISDSNPEATGGTVVDTDIGGVAYRIHLFTNTGNSTFAVARGGEVEYLIVAGGGGGGLGSGANAGGSGGGAGGLRAGIINLTPQTYTITVGAGGTGVYNGTGGTNTGAIGGVGGNSSAFGLVAAGGGGGASYNTTNKVAGMNGGSGAGGHPRTTPYATGYGFGNTPATDPPQGNNGSIVVSGSGSFGGGGGGGGAGSPGEDMQAFGAVGNHPGINAGHGIVSSITGSSIFYAGGGGGGAASGTGNEGLGGLGGGGNGGRHTPIIRAQDANPNTGGGGGGGNAQGNPNNGGGNGGSGIVVVRYRRNASTATNPTRTIIATQPNNYQIVNNGLVLHFDPSNSVSYPGSGSTLINLKNSSLNASAVNGTPSFSNSNGGIFTVSNNNWSVADNSLLDLTGTRTLITWFKMSSSTGGTGIAGKANSSVYGLALGYGWSSGGFMALAWNSSNAPALSQDPQRDINQWNFLVALINSSDQRVIYAFDALGVRTAVAAAASQSWNNSLAFGIGAANGDGTSRVPSGSQFGSVFVYDRELSFTELEQIFNATRSRYGL